MNKDAITFIDRAAERGVALVSVLLMMALLLILVLGISITSISELGVSSNYSNQALAFEAAEAGVNHGATLISNFQVDTASTLSPMTQFLNLRGPTFPTNFFPNKVFDANFALAASNTYFYNAFADPSKFTTGSVAIPATGLALTDATGQPTGATYRVAVIDDEALSDSNPSPNPSVPNFNPPAGTWLEAQTSTTPACAAGDPTCDENNRVVLYSTGTYANASVTLEGWVGFVPYPALLSNGDIAAGGNSQINGTYGSVHANGNLSIAGSAYIAQSATASGTETGGNSSNVGGFFGGGQPTIYMPKFVTADPPNPPSGTDTSPHIQSYLTQYTDIMLIDPGFAMGAESTYSSSSTNNATQTLKKLADSVGLSYSSLRAITDPSSAQAIKIDRTTSPPTPSVISISSTGWSYSGGSWGLNSAPLAGIVTSSTPSSQSPANNNAYTFYVVGTDNYNMTSPSLSTPNGGNIKITGNVGSDSNPVELTVLSTGSIELGGTPNLVAHLRASTPELPPYDKPSILFATVEDLKVDGDLDIASKFNGIIYLGEQFNLSGNGRFDGQVLGENNMDVSGSPVSTNQIWGHFNLTLNTGGMIGTVKVISWRQVKQ